MAWPPDGQVARSRLGHGCCGRRPRGQLRRRCCLPWMPSRGCLTHRPLARIRTLQAGTDSDRVMARLKARGGPAPRGRGAGRKVRSQRLRQTRGAAPVSETRKPRPPPRARRRRAGNSSAVYRAGARGPAGRWAQGHGPRATSLCRRRASRPGGSGPRPAPHLVSRRPASALGIRVRRESPSVRQHSDRPL